MARRKRCARGRTTRSPATIHVPLWGRGGRRSSSRGRRGAEEGRGEQHLHVCWRPAVIIIVAWPIRTAVGIGGTVGHRRCAFRNGRLGNKPVIGSRRHLPLAFTLNRSAPIAVPANPPAAPRDGRGRLSPSREVHKRAAATANTSIGRKGVNADATRRPTPNNGILRR